MTTVNEVTKDTDEIVSDGKDSALVSAKIINQDDNTAAPNIKVSWKVNSPGKLSDDSSTTDDNGNAQVSVSAESAGELTITATTDDDTTGKSVTINAKENNMTNSVQSCTAEPSSIPSDGSLKAVLTANVMNDDSSPAEGVSVSWAFLNGENVGNITDDTSVTDADGNATTTLAATGTGVLKVSATTEDDTAGKSATIVSTTPLTAPHVLNANEENGYTLDYYAINFGVAAIVPHFAGAQAGSTVTFYWGNYDMEFQIDDPNADLPRDINISTGFPAEALGDGKYEIYYTVSDVAGNITTSSVLNITVFNSGETVPTLKQPAVTTNDNNYINVAIAQAGVVVTVDYEDMASDDYITLFWQAYDAQNRKLDAYSTTSNKTLTEDDLPYSLTLDLAQFISDTTGGYEGHVNAYYTVNRSGDNSGQALLSYTNTVQVKTTLPY